MMLWRVIPLNTSTNFSEWRLDRMQGEPASTSVQTETTPETRVRSHHHTSVLFHHEPHQHKPRNANLLYQAERAAGGFNEKLAIGLTKSVGSMWTAYTFTVLAIVGLFAILGLLSPIVALLVAWSSQTLIQLVLLPVIMVGQNVLGRKAELQAEEAYATTMKTYSDIEAVMKHLDDQDEKIFVLEQLIKAQTDSILSLVQDLAKETTQRG